MEINTRLENAEYVDIATDQIRPYAGQPRKYFDEKVIEILSESVKHGQTEPILVKRLDPPVQGCQYELIKGERRWRASKKAGLSSIRAVVVDVKNELDQYLLSLTDVQQEALSVPEIVAAVLRLSKTGYSLEEIGVVFGKSESWVEKHLTLEKLKPDVLALTGPETTEDKRISLGSALAIAVGVERSRQTKFAKIISENQLSVTDAKSLISKSASDAGGVCAIAAKTQKSGGKQNTKTSISFLSIIRFAAETKGALEYFMEHPERFEKILRAATKESREKILSELQECAVMLSKLKALVEKK